MSCVRTGLGAALILLGACSSVGDNGAGVGPSVATFVSIAPPATAAPVTSPSPPTCPGYIGVKITAVRPSANGVNAVDLAGQITNHYSGSATVGLIGVLGTSSKGLKATTTLATTVQVAPGATQPFAVKDVFFTYTSGQFQDPVNDTTVTVAVGTSGSGVIDAPGCFSDITVRPA